MEVVVCWAAADGGMRLVGRRTELAGFGDVGEGREEGGEEGEGDGEAEQRERRQQSAPHEQAEQEPSDLWRTDNVERHPGLLRTPAGRSDGPARRGPRLGGQAGAGPSRSTCLRTSAVAFASASVAFALSIHEIASSEPSLPWTM